MTYLALKKTALPKNRVIGMGGILDSARFKTYLSLALGVPSAEIQGMVIGGHGDTTMIPLARLATYNGIPVSTLLSAEKLDQVVADTMVGGATLTALLGTSAWYAPGASAAYLVDSILGDFRRLLPCSVLLEGEYELDNLCIGVPCIIGGNGLESIVEIELDSGEQEKLDLSAQKVRQMNQSLDSIS